MGQSINACGLHGAARRGGRHAALAEEAGAEADGGAAALAEADAAGVLSSLEQAASSSIATAGKSAFRIRAIVGGVNHPLQPGCR